MTHQKKITFKIQIKIEKINIFWTGGLDSTYRIAQLSKYEVTVQPYYLFDPTRPGKEYEIKAMTEISRALKEHPETKFDLLPLETFPAREVPEDKEITEAWMKMHQMVGLGSQYDWLARFIKYFGKGEKFEYGLEKEAASKAYICLIEKGHVRKIKAGQFEYAEIDPVKSIPELKTLFGNIRLPLPLFEMSKKDLVEDFKKMNLESVMKLTWFCHTPINNEPCGTCSPCRQVVDAGMEWRIPEAGMARHRKSNRPIPKMVRKAKSVVTKNPLVMKLRKAMR